MPIGRAGQSMKGCSAKMTHALAAIAAWWPCCRRVSPRRLQLATLRLISRRPVRQEPHGQLSWIQHARQPDLADEWRHRSRGIHQDKLANEKYAALGRLRRPGVWFALPHNSPQNDPQEIVRIGQFGRSVADRRHPTQRPSFLLRRIRSGEFASAGSPMLDSMDRPNQPALSKSARTAPCGFVELLQMRLLRCRHLVVETKAERVAANGRPLGRGGNLAEVRERFAEHSGVPAARNVRGGVARVGCSRTGRGALSGRGPHARLTPCATDKSAVVCSC